MATWKKVIVSGSNISQLVNDANYLVDAQSGAVLTGSFSGSFKGDGSQLTGISASVLLNALTDGNGISDFTYDGSGAASVAVEVSGSTLEVGAGGVRVADGGIDTAQLAANAVTTAKITDGNVTNAKLANSSIYLAGGNGLTGDGSTALGASGSLAVGAGAGIIVTADAVSVDTGSNHFISGSRDAISVSDTTGASGINMSYADGVVSGVLQNSSITLGSTSVDLGATATTVSGLTLTGAVASGSFTGSFIGNGSGLTGVSASVLLGTLTDGNGIADFTFDGSSNASVTVEVSGSTLTVDAGGVKVSDLGIGTAQLAAGAVTNVKLANPTTLLGSTTLTLGASASAVDGLTLTGAVASGSFTGSFAGDGSGLTGVASDLVVSGSTGAGSVDLLTQALSIVGTANEVETSMSGQTLTIGLPNDVTIGQDLLVTRNLTVQGTASFQHETNLDVADRFIRLASGSTANGDGGIVIQQDSAANGEAFAFDSATTRWGVTGSYDASTNSITPDAFMAAAVLGAGTDPSTAPSRYAVKGNLFIGSDEAIWIYS